MKNVLFIGNRSGVLREISRFGELEVTAVYALQNSRLQQDTNELRCNVRLFECTEEDAVLDEISGADFDLLISNGCPFILPIENLRYPNRLFLNVHPGLLPNGRGRHPINGVVLRDERFTGATLHYMDQGADTGPIIHQEKAEITEDIDIGLLYSMTFELEVSTFRIGMQKLIDSGFAYRGEAQTGQGWYYTRKEQDQAVDFETMPTADILRRIRAFGIPSQGVIARLGDHEVRIFDAEAISNAALLTRYASQPSGSIVLRYEDRLLVRTREGLIKIKSFRPVTAI
jgi:methionyl-tRNA formyltransferase